MNQLRTLYLAKKVCRKCKAAQSPLRTTCLKGCGPYLRPRRSKRE